jgi:hypothetical protein
MSDMDQLFEQSVNDEAAAKAEQEMLLAVGTYHTTPPFTVSGQHFEANGEKPARTVFRAYGPVKWAGRVDPKEGAGSKEGRISISFSPDLQKKLNERTGEMDYDRPSKNYIALRRAYIVAYGQNPASMGDLKSYLESYPLSLRIGQVGTQADATGEPGNMVFNISAVRD